MPVIRLLSAQARSTTSFESPSTTAVAVSGTILTFTPLVTEQGLSLIHIFGLWFVLSNKERETVGYKCRVAPGMAMTGNGANDTPVQSQVERDKTVATNEGSR